MNQSTESRIMQSFRMLENGLDDLKREIIGNPEFGNRGIVGRLSDSEDNIEELKEKVEEINKANFKQKVIVGTAAGVGGAVAGLGGKAILAKMIHFIWK